MADAVAAAVPQLHLICRISPDKFAIDTNPCSIVSISSDEDTGDVFLADALNERVVVLSTRASDARATVAYQSTRPETPAAVCLMRATNTLLVCDQKREYPKGAPVEFSLVALSRDGRQWAERSRKHLAVNCRAQGVYMFKTLCALTDSELLFGVKCSTRLYRLRVDSARRLLVAAELVAPEQYVDVAAFAAAGGTRIALALFDSKSLGLYALRDDRLTELSRITTAGWIGSARVLALNGGRLLLAEAENGEASDSVCEVEASGDRLARRAVLLSPASACDVRSWCAEPNRLLTCGWYTDMCVFKWEQ